MENITLEDKRNMIVALEWFFFQNVHNEGGRADCQDEPETFYVMRKSQFDAWPEYLIESYLQDLQVAKLTERNPVAEKYAWMMKDTALEQFQSIQDLLPEISPEALNLINSIVCIQLQWMDEYVALYPHIASRNRITRNQNTHGGFTSFETYLRGELCTYSLQTLKNYLKYIHFCQGKGINLVCLTMEYTVQKYGYQNISEADSHI